MEEHIRGDILQVLKNAIKAINNEDVKSLKALSNMTIHNASIHQDEYSIGISVLIFTLAKLYERDVHERFGSFHFSTYTKELENMIRALEEHRLKDFDNLLKKIIEDLKSSDKRIRKYILDVLQTAKISKASRLHEHGISIGRTAEFLGISKFELMEYVGTTYIADMKETTSSAKARLKVARELFK